MYYAIDGDDVGRKLEFLLLSNDAEGAAFFSQEITREIENLHQFFMKFHSQIIFSTGDGILAFSAESIDVSALTVSGSGTTFSIGIGSTTANALLALKKAKGLGKARVETIE